MLWSKDLRHESALYSNDISESFRPAGVTSPKFRKVKQTVALPPPLSGDGEAPSLAGGLPSPQSQTLGNNGAGDGWWSRPRPLDSPINLDEALAAPSQIFPSAYFVKLPPPPPPLPWRTSRCISCRGFFRCASCRGGKISVYWRRCAFIEANVLA